MKELPHTHSCFVCGDSNAIGLKLRFETDGQVVRARFCPGSEHVGFKGVVHGGLTAAILDEIMVWACAVRTRQFAYCAELNVRYLRPLTPQQPVNLIGELVENRRGKIFLTRGTVADLAGQKLAEATGKYMPIPASAVTEMAADFVGGESWLQEQPPAT